MKRKNFFDDFKYTKALKNRNKSQDTIDFFLKIHRTINVTNYMILF